MKKNILTTLTILWSLCTYGQLANENFETWESRTVVNDVLLWKTSNDRTDTNKTVTKSTESYDQDASMRLETRTNGTDIFFAFTILGDLGDNGPEGGFPYSSTPDSIIFWTKYDVMDGDSATAFVATRNNGTNLAMDVVKWVGTQNTWERRAFEISPQANVDSLVVAFVAGDALEDRAQAGTWIMIDNILIKDTDGNITEAPNHSFEDWDEYQIDNPENWYTIEEKIVSKSTSSHAGIYAARLETKELNGELKSGLLSNAPYSQTDNWFGTVSISSRPIKMELYAKYSGVDDDIAGFTIHLLKDGVIIGQGVKASADTSSTYQLLTVAIEYTETSTPDAMRIVFSAGSKIGSVLYVDDVTLVEETNGVEQIEGLTSLKYYPNPTNDKLSISFESITSNNASVELYNLQGSLVLSEAWATIVGKNLQSINVHHLEKGIYSIALRVDGKIAYTKLIIN